MQRSSASLQTTYEAVAKLQDWDRDALEIPLGQYGDPYDVKAHRSG